MGCDIEDQKYMVLFIIWMSYTFVCVAAVILLVKAASGRKTKPILIVSMLAFCWASMGVPLLLQDLLNLQINLSCGNKTPQEKQKQQQDMFPNYNIWVAYFIANLCLSWYVLFLTVRFLLPMTQEFHVSPERNIRHKFRKILAKRFKVLLLWMCLLTIPEFIVKYLQSTTEVQSNNHDDMVVPMVIISMMYSIADKDRTVCSFPTSQQGLHTAFVMFSKDELFRSRNECSSANLSTSTIGRRTCFSSCVKPMHC